MLLPEGEDPDTLVRSRGAEVFRDLQEQAMPLSDALWQTEAGSIAQLSPEKRAAVEHRLMQLTEKMADPTLYDRQTEFKAVSEERSNIEELVQTYKHYKKIKSDLEGAKDLLKSETDEEMIFMKLEL